MLTQENLILTRAEPNGNGGLQFLYRVQDYGVAASSFPQEDISRIHWQVDIIKFTDPKRIKYDACYDTDLAKKTLIFYNDDTTNEFLHKAFAYFKELAMLEGMLNPQ